MYQSNAHEQWANEHRDCDSQPSVMDFARVSFVLSEHAGHGPGCAQYLAALTRASSVLD
ncbi:hypothetical protein [Nocardia bovistercoris]|uniref:Uncharacterized protein n=1 Tax=Nocardia bovistercoris TaxID=2785916 RepID=A0A931IAU5_9NOCA|nr:hypothetical protein [Nocardia bovistercoris]MBH0777060.1 hypothetical protein [Nocardia bovistercoris]